jgi:hypothetical protein
MVGGEGWLAIAIALQCPNLETEASSANLHTKFHVNGFVQS